VLLYEFKVQIAQYMVRLGHTAMRTLADLIAFDLAHCEAEMKYFGQEIFEAAEETSGDLNDPVYIDARARCVRLARTQGIDAALARDRLDAIVAPSYSFASSPAAVAGYPNISVPIGLTSAGGPAGIWMYAGAHQEAKLLRLAYDLEQELDARSQPRFRHHVPPKPPDAGICSSASTAAPRTSAQPKMDARRLRML
jgi:amidase